MVAGSHLWKRSLIQRRFTGPRGPPKKEMRATEDLKIVTTPPRDKSLTRTEIVTEEIKPSRYTDRESKLVAKDKKESDDNPDRQFGRIGRRYVGIKDRRESLWTEITKDLVVKEALERSGYEYEETGSFYYIFSYLEQVCFTRPLYYQPAAYPLLTTLHRRTWMH